MENNENITPEVQELLDALAAHGSDCRRQADLSDLIDNLAAEEPKRRHFWPWVGAAAVAACIALVLMPSRQPGMVAEVQKTVRITPQVEEPVIPAPVQETIVAAAASVSKFYDTCIPQASTVSTDTFAPMSQIDTNIPLAPVPVQTIAPISVPMRRTVSAQLICYDCAPEKERRTAPDVNLLGMPLDPNMNGTMLALATF